MVTDILSDEVVEDLMLDGIKLIQKTKGFKFGSDAVLLADFANIAPNSKVLEFGTGSGIIALLCAHHYKNIKMDCVEIQPNYADMAQRNVELNTLEDIIRIYNCDLREIAGVLPVASYDYVITNPPYKKLGSGEDCPDSERAIARSEICASLEDVIKTSCLMLKPTGKLEMVHRPSRLNDIVLTLAKYNMTIKKLRFVSASQSQPPSIMLVEAYRNAKSDLTVMPPLILRDEQGETLETKKIYRRK